VSRTLRLAQGKGRHDGNQPPRAPSCKFQGLGLAKPGILLSPPPGGRTGASMTFAASIITLYPEMFPGSLGMSLAGRALEEGAWSLETIALRDFGKGKHKNVDDTPAGGGAGMVLRADVLGEAIDSIPDHGGEDTRPRLLMSPRGRVLDQNYVRELADGPGAVIVCGRFEGVDQRVIDAKNLTEVSIGDYILSGGEPAAMILLDAIVRLLPGVMGNDQSGAHESFESGLLEEPLYTRPLEWEGLSIPDVLTSGNHKKVADWQREQAEKLTQERRPDLLDQIAAPGTAVQIMPAIPVTDLNQGVAFYTDTLGFNCVYLDEGGTAVLQLDKVELHLWLSNDESWIGERREKPIVSGAETFIAGTHSCRIKVHDITALWKKMKKSKHIHPNASLEKKEWGTTEFGVLDPWGNLVIFYEWL